MIYSMTFRGRQKNTLTTYFKGPGGKEGASHPTAQPGCLGMMLPSMGDPRVPHSTGIDHGDRACPLRGARQRRPAWWLMSPFWVT